MLSLMRFVETSMKNLTSEVTPKNRAAIIIVESFLL